MHKLSVYSITEVQVLTITIAYIDGECFNGRGRSVAGVLHLFELREPVPHADQFARRRYWHAIASRRCQRTVDLYNAAGRGHVTARSRDHTASR